ncbi:MAG: hypothetical protein ACK4IX_10690 [Candidatus Sericytochromatia bacterium]
MFLTIINFYILIKNNSFNSLGKLNLKIWKEEKELTTIVNRINKLNGKVITNGWWQAPEISFYTNKIFYDRTQLTAVNHNKQIYLLVTNYQNSYWPQTDLEEVCDDVVLCEKKVLICKYKKGIPLNLISEQAKGTSKCDKFKWD